jgi:hypothetical protein
MAGSGQEAGVADSAALLDASSPDSSRSDGAVDAGPDVGTDAGYDVGTDAGQDGAADAPRDGTVTPD